MGDTITTTMGAGDEFGAPRFWEDTFDFTISDIAALVALSAAIGLRTGFLALCGWRRFRSGLDTHRSQ